MVQSILSSVDGDEVNSINDTVESQQIAGFIRDSYYELIAGLNLPETFTVFQLDPSLDPDKPTLMYIPEVIQNLIWMKYNKSLDEADPDNYQDVHYLPLEDFMQNMYNLGSSSDVPTPTDTGSFEHDAGGGLVTFFHRNDRAPMYYTTFDDRTLIFDSYDASMDGTLQSSKTVCYGEKVQTFLMEDDFVPNLDPKQFSLLLNEAKSQTFVESKGAANPKAEQRARRGWVRSTKKKFKIDKFNYQARTTTNFGRS